MSLWQGTHRRTRGRSAILVRVASFAACLVLLALAGGAVVTAIDVERSAGRLERSGDLVEAYVNLPRAAAIQHAVEDGAENSADRDRLRREFKRAGHLISTSAEVLQRLGDPRDAALAKEILMTERRYGRTIERYLDALDAGRTRSTVAAEEATDAPSQALQNLVSEGGPQQATASLSEIDALRSSQSNGVSFTLVAMVVGLVIVTGLFLLLRSLSLRVERATRNEFTRLEQAALTDSLTGIRNHRAFEEDLARALRHRARHGTRLTLMTIDVDGLKGINDSDGHQAGDRTIRTVASTLAETVRTSEFAYRVGGDEFAALLPESAGWGAFAVAQRLHEALRSHPGGPRVSVGIAEATEHSTRDGLIEEADIALMDAKTGGRDTVIFLPGMAHPQIVDEGEERRHRGSLAAALARAVDAKDSYTSSHSETVAELSAIIATELDLEREHVTAIRLGGLVHDVGKIGVPDAILQKPGPLEPWEFDVIKTHSTLGHKILSGTDLSREAPWVLHHHERMDGAGYPDRLAGAAIPIESRIIHVADAYEAMTSDRPYRDGMGHAAAVDELRTHSGTQFDPGCVAALLRGLPADGPALGDRGPQKLSRA